MQSEQWPEPTRKRVTKLNSGHKLTAESNVSKKEDIRAKPKAKRMQSLVNVLEANEKTTVEALPSKDKADKADKVQVDAGDSKNNKTNKKQLKGPKINVGVLPADSEKPEGGVDLLPGS